MPDLTDEDREIICLISEADDSGVQPSLLEDCYLQGMAAGRARAIEEAAKACDRLAKPAHTYASENADHYRGFDAGAARCAAAIRALNARPASAD